MDLLPDYAVIGSLDLCTLPPVVLADWPHLKQLRNNDPDIRQLLRDLETNPHADSDMNSPPQFVVHDSLLFYSDPISIQ